MKRCCALLSAGLLTACLVTDPRPPPSSVLFTVSSDEPLRSGFTTDDGWSVQYSRFLISLGHASPEGDACLFYSDAAYNRVLDARRAGPQKLSIIYMLYTCSIDYEVSSPWSDSVLGEGATATDRELMRTPGADDYVKESGISLRVEGTAEKDGVGKRFSWSFRNRIDSTNCSFVVDGQVVQGVDLHENEAVTRDFTVHGATLFQDRLDAGQAKLRFGALAAADEGGDADGEVTLEELGQVPLADVAVADRYSDADPGWTTLEDYVYRGLFTKVVRPQGDGSCEETEIFPNDRTPH